MEEFVCLALYTKAYRGPEGGGTVDEQCERRLSSVKKRMDPAMNLLVFTEKSCECRNHIADVREHYEFATVDPARIYLRKNLAEKLFPLDFPGLCRLFAKEGRFAVWELDPGQMEKKGYPYEKRDEGSFGTAPEKYMELCGELRERYGELLPFFQNMIIKDMLPLFFGEDGSQKPLLRQILVSIDDDILCGTGCIYEDVLLKILSLKYGEDVEKGLVYRSGKLKYQNLSLFPLKEIPFVVTEIKLVKDRINISGHVLLPLEYSEIEYYCMDNRNRRYELSLEQDGEICFLGELLHRRKRFLVEFPAGKKPQGIRFMYCYRGMYQARVRMEFAEQLGMVPDTRYNFRLQDGYLWKAEKRILFAAPLQKRTRIKLFFTFLWKSFKI
ncbi:MAG: hypothetical protein HFG34_05660 [Eubacterium sp.]|nr:hypothetical protein [Eubacterium sp.]